MWHAFLNSEIGPHKGATHHRKLNSASQESRSLPALKRKVSSLEGCEGGLLEGIQAAPDQDPEAGEEAKPDFSAVRGEDDFRASCNSLCLSVLDSGKTNQAPQINK